MCPACASIGVLTLAGMVSTAGLTGMLVRLRAGRGRDNHKLNRRERST